MASRIKARELRAPAQRGSHRTPTPLVSWEHICSLTDEIFTDLTYAVLLGETLPQRPRQQRNRMLAFLTRRHLNLPLTGFAVRHHKIHPTLFDLAE